MRLVRAPVIVCVGALLGSLVNGSPASAAGREHRCVRHPCDDAGAHVYNVGPEMGPCGLPTWEASTIRARSAE